MRPPFAQLVVRTPWSFQRGASDLRRLAAAAARRGVSAVGVVDRGGLCAAVPAWDILSAAGVRPILGAEVEGADGRAVLLARDRRGYAALCAAVTAAALDPNLVLSRQLGEHSAGLFVLCRQPALLRALARVLPRRRLRVSVRAADEVRILAPLGHELGLRPVAVGDVHYTSPSEARLHRTLRAVGLGTTPGEVPAGELAPPGAWLAGEEEMRRRFDGAGEAVDEAGRVAGACRLSLPSDLAFGRWHFPRLLDGSAEAPVRALAGLCERGLSRRLGGAPGGRYRRRLAREMEVIGGLGYAPYFLVLADLVRFARRRRIAHWGRGSAAGSLAAFSLGLAPVDPLAEGLLFERFLNPARRDPPDVDLDLDWRRRDEAIAHLERRHGTDRVARLGTHVTYGARGAVRELGKVAGVPGEVLARLSRALPPSSRTLSPAALRRAARVSGLAVDTPPLSGVLADAAVLQSFPRHLGLHPSGVVVAPRPLAGWVPLFRTQRGVVATQWSMDAVARAGLIKLDLLGNRALAALEDASAVVVAGGGRDPRTVNAKGDPETRTLIRRGETMACFHLESPAIRSLLRRMRCRGFDDVVAASSVVRPGVAGSGMLEEFLSRRDAGSAGPGPEAMAELLAATHGVMVHQEDVMLVAHRLAGLPLADADQLRRALARRAHRHRLPVLRERFLAGARGQGLSAGDARELWRQIASFAGYAFCKAHSASFAALSFRAAYLRAHHPAELMAAVLSQRGGFYGQAAYVSECKRMGLEVLPPCVNRSQVAFTGEGRRVRVGLMQVRALRPESAVALVRERGGKGVFRSLEELVARVALRGREVDALIRCGGLDRCGRERVEGPGALIAEMETLGIPVSGHPLDLFLPLQRGPRDLAADLPGLVGRRVRLAAWRVAHRPLRTRGGREMELLSFEDEGAMYEAAVFPSVYPRVARVLLEPGPFWVRGLVCEDRGDPHVVVEGIEPMEVQDVGTRNHGGRDPARDGADGMGVAGLSQRLAGG